MSLNDLIDHIRDDKPAFIELTYDEWTKVSDRRHDALQVLVDDDSLKEGMIARILGVPVYLREIRDSLTGFERLVRNDDPV